MHVILSKKIWALITILLVAAVACGAAAVFNRYPASYPVEISLPSTTPAIVQIKIGGSVNNPGIYAVREDDTLESLLQAAGGLADGAGLDDIKIEVTPDDNNSPEKININRADAWLLEALPGIGPSLAGRIIDFRQLNGPFKNINDLTNIEGFGPSLFEKIKNLVTVTD